MEFGKKHSNASYKVGYYNGLIVKKDSKGRYITKSLKKHYLPKGTRVYYEKAKSLKSKKIEKKSTKKTKKPKKYKKVKSKDKTKKVIGKRLSARAVFDEKGKMALGKSFKILQPDGSMKMKVLRLRKNGSPYFANKFGGLCYNCSSNLSIGMKKINMKFGNNNFGHVHNCFG